LLGCPSSLTYREMPKARFGRWCTLTDTIISKTNATRIALVQQIMISHYATRVVMTPPIAWHTVNPACHPCYSVYLHSQ